MDRSLLLWWMAASTLEATGERVASTCGRIAYSAMRKKKFTYDIGHKVWLYFLFFWRINLQKSSSECLDRSRGNFIHMFPKPWIWGCSQIINWTNCPAVMLDWTKILNYFSWTASSIDVKCHPMWIFILFIINFNLIGCMIWQSEWFNILNLGSGILDKSWIKYV